MSTAHPDTCECTECLQAGCFHSWKLCDDDPGEYPTTKYCTDCGLESEDVDDEIWRELEARKEAAESGDWM